MHTYYQVIMKSNSICIDLLQYMSQTDLWAADGTHNATQFWGQQSKNGAIIFKE